MKGFFLKKDKAFRGVSNYILFFFIPFVFLFFNISIETSHSTQISLLQSFEDPNPNPISATNDGALNTTINNPTPDENEFLGNSVAPLGSDKVVMGTPNDDTDATDTGIFYIYDLKGNLIRTIHDPNSAKGDKFGNTIATSGKYVLVAATNDVSGGGVTGGAAYLFNGNTGDLIATYNNPTPEIEDSFGFTIITIGSGFILTATHVDLGDKDAGEVHHLLARPVQMGEELGKVGGGPSVYDDMTGHGTTTVTQKDSTEAAIPNLLQDDLHVLLGDSNNSLFYEVDTLSVKANPATAPGGLKEIQVDQIFDNDTDILVDQNDMTPDEANNIITSFSTDPSDVEIIIINPEPTSVLLLLLSLIGFFFKKRS